MPVEHSLDRAEAEYMETGVLNSDFATSRSFRDYRTKEGADDGIRRARDGLSKKKRLRNRVALVVVRMVKKAMDHSENLGMNPKMRKKLNSEIEDRSKDLRNGIRGADGLLTLIIERNKDMSPRDENKNMTGEFNENMVNLNPRSLFKNDDELHQFFVEQLAEIQDQGIDKDRYTLHELHTLAELLVAISKSIPERYPEVLRHPMLPLFNFSAKYDDEETGENYNKPLSDLFELFGKS